MALKSMVMEFGSGVDIRGGDCTKAAVRAVEAALRHNSITFAQAFDQPREAMVIRVAIGVPRPDEVDTGKVAGVLPYGSAEVRVEEGGMEIARDDGGVGTTLANAALTVYLDVPEGGMA
ncbi:Lin0512 family protein [Hoeflea prorocentri]|uniref:Lin0512 family protein n=1 Tax=Hoeflea prorocentri TaxID=1922333 RepID=A0A9X3UMD8_9HYPH|nr:Lin0512 family protein [Hoeflea prorocentri]MCY6383393.1 Lin0512 family protein [Hoeflea prorocentri]MDA5401193.1 Lin0512 family protein [Hoeflea prorocentri]